MVVSTKRCKKGGVCFIAYSLLVLLLLFNPSYAKAPIEVTVKQSAHEVWQRQQILITLEVKTDDPFSRLDSEDFSQKGFSIIPFEQVRTENADNKNNTHLIMRWVIFPFIAGEYQLELPRIRYRPNSGRIQTLALEALTLKVKKLPLYVPPTMPVGKINLQQNWAEGSVLSLNHLVEWQIMVEGVAVAKQTMPPISRQIISTKALQILPIQSFQKTLKTEKGLENTLHYKIPLKAKHSGKLNLPKIEIQYFEPVSGKLETARLSPPFIISLSKWQMGVIIFLIILLLITLLKFLIRKLKASIEKRIQRKLALQSLKQASNYQQIRYALNRLALTEGWENNKSLSTFCDLWEEKYGLSPELTSNIKKLQTMEFSKNNEANIQEISGLLQKAINRGVHK